MDVLAGGVTQGVCSVQLGCPHPNALRVEVRMVAIMLAKAWPEFGQEKGAAGGVHSLGCMHDTPFLAIGRIVSCL